MHHGLWALLLSVAGSMSAVASRPGDAPKRFEAWESRPAPHELVQALMHWRQRSEQQTIIAPAWTALAVPMQGTELRASGRVSAVHRAFDPQQNAVVLWLGGASGGLWKQRADDFQWLPVSDGLTASPSVGAFAIRADGRILIGGGDPWRYSGNGVHFSDDGGGHWNAAFMPQIPASIYRLRLAEGAPQRVWLATPIGLMRSDDGGASFVVAASGHFTEIVQDPLNQARWYAASQQHGILRSDDGGNVFHPDNPPGLMALGFLGRISLAPSAAQPNLVFALVCDGGDTRAIFRRRDGGGWEHAHAAPDFGWGQSFHTCALSAHPNNPNIVLAGSGGAEFTVDALAPLPSWTSLWTGHSDTTGFLWHDDDTFYASNDGGLYRIDRHTLTIDDVENTRGLSLGQVYGVGALALARSSPGTASAGYQDNGVARVRLGVAPEIIINGETDASTLTISPRDDNRVGAVIGLPFSRYLSFNGGTNFSLISCPSGLHSSNSMPLLFDPAPGTATSVRLYHTSSSSETASASIWRLDLSRPCFGGASQSLRFDDAPGFRPDFLDIANDSSQLRAYVTDSGESGERRIARVNSPKGFRNGLMSLTWLTPPVARTGRAMSDPYRPHRVLWWPNPGTGPAGLWIHDADGEGEGWVDASGDLAALGSALQVRRPATHPDDESRFWLATNLGVLVSADGGNHWSVDHHGLPAVIDAVELQGERIDAQPPRWRLWLGTYGRGLWLREELLDRLFDDGFEP